jgi:hypothetical protein
MITAIDRSHRFTAVAFSSMWGAVTVFVEKVSQLGVKRRVSGVFGESCVIICEKTVTALR